MDAGSSIASDGSASAIIAASCSAKSGLPSDVAEMRCRRSASSIPSASTSSLVSRSLSCSRSSLVAARLGRASSSSGRPMHSSTSGPFANAAMYSTRSSIVGSAQWRSSSATSSGLRSELRSSSRRTAQNTSVLGAAVSATLVTAWSRSSTTAPSSVPARTDAAASIPPRSVTSCCSGQNVMPLPYGRQRPVATSATSSSSIASSRAIRDFPIPAVPRMVTMPQRRASNASRTSRRSASSSFVRLTSGASSRRAYPDASVSTSSRRKRATGSRLPFAEKRSRGPTLTASFTSGYVAVPIRIVPGSAACSSRLARFTASPVTNPSPDPWSPATTSPVLMPIRQASSTPQVWRSSLFSSARARCISVAVLTARSASSSWVTGTPNTAITSSPRNRSTVPPCCRTISAIDSA